MSEFRAWVYQVWQNNCVERDSYNELPFTQKEYWARYKYWLKREFCHKKSLINQ
jgi:hypothetical protein